MNTSDCEKLIETQMTQTRRLHSPLRNRTRLYASLFIYFQRDRDTFDEQIMKWITLPNTFTFRRQNFMVDCTRIFVRWNFRCIVEALLESKRIKRQRQNSIQWLTQRRVHYGSSLNKIHIFVHISTVSIRTVTSFREKLDAVGRRQRQSFSLALESVWWEKEQQQYEK